MELPNACRGSQRLIALAQKLHIYKPPPFPYDDDIEEQRIEETAGKVVSQVGFAKSDTPVAKDPEKFRPKRAAVLICPAQSLWPGSQHRWTRPRYNTAPDLALARSELSKHLRQLCRGRHRAHCLQHSVAFAVVNPGPDWNKSPSRSLHSVRFIVVLPKTCYIQFDYLVYYEKTITGKLTYGAIIYLNEIQVQRFLFWFDADEIRIDLPLSDSIYFIVGIITDSIYRRLIAFTSLLQSIPNCFSDGPISWS
ncbi:hypothetical protein ACFX2F_007080 [Malus domestica]